MNDQMILFIFGTSNAVLWILLLSAKRDIGMLKIGLSILIDTAGKKKFFDAIDGKKNKKAAK